MDRTGAALFALAGVQPTVVDQRRASDIGRHARLELAFERRGPQTVLARSYAEPPLRIGRCFEEGAGAHAIVTSSAPGIFGGDCFRQIVQVGRGAHVRLTSQAALQIHASPSSEQARIQTTCTVDAGGLLQCAWHPAIPFPNSHLQQRIEIDLARDSRLVWNDAFTAGRAARGERWVFGRLAHQLVVRRCGSLEYLERYQVVPGAHDPGHPWVAGRGSYFGTVLASGWELSDEDVDDLHRALAAISSLRAAADLPGRRILLVRLVGESAVAFHAGCSATAEMLGGWFARS